MSAVLVVKGRAHLCSWPDREPSNSANKAVVPSLAFVAAARCRKAESVADTALRAACCRASSNANSVAAGSCLQTTQALRYTSAAAFGEGTTLDLLM